MTKEIPQTPGASLLTDGLYRHKQEILGALLIGLDAAREVAANYHQAMAGYRENTHKQLDDDVIMIERAISFLTDDV